MAAFMQGLRYAAIVEANHSVIAAEAARCFNVKIIEEPPVVQILAPKAWWRAWSIRRSSIPIVAQSRGSGGSTLTRALSLMRERRNGSVCARAKTNSSTSTKTTRRRKASKKQKPSKPDSVRSVPRSTPARHVCLQTRSGLQLGRKAIGACASTKILSSPRR